MDPVPDRSGDCSPVVSLLYICVLLARCRALVKPVETPPATLVEPVETPPHALVEPVETPPHAAVEPVETQPATLVEPVETPRTALVEPVETPRGRVVAPFVIDRDDEERDARPICISPKEFPGFPPYGTVARL
ncbi:hypothetical protein [Cryobacterium arcticum]|uniref:Uncharacterized protein n=1 Tax=Cryobacterium arcticum TaxID=670052 RepID=A0A1B1BLU7_9MICO|nr:hypothetical protein [Cryobacterium arcticum]ANP73494.1 hypothetical protein PA27867_2547 [Cryobacterium arcticum]